LILELGLDFSRLETQDNYLKLPDGSVAPNQMERTPPNIVFPLIKDTGRKFSYSRLKLIQTYSLHFYLDSIDTVSQRTESTLRNTLRIDNHPSRKHSTLDHSWALPTNKQTQKLSIMSIPKQPIFNGTMIPRIVLDLVDEPHAHPTHEGPYLESGKFFMEPDLPDDEDPDATEIRSIASTTMTLHGDRPCSVSGSKSRSRTHSTGGNLKCLTLLICVCRNSGN
jgi:hypothetical protein